MAPVFTTSAVVSGQLKSNVSLTDFRGRYVVLLFYPADFTFVCPTELLAFARHYEEFQRLNCEVLAISVDSQLAHYAWEHTPLQKGGIGQVVVPLLSDSNRAISTAYNVLQPEQGVDVRATFLLDPRGVIRSVMMNDVQVGRSVKETLRLVQAFQYSEENGEVIPCDWQPGEEAMKAEPNEVISYLNHLKDNAPQTQTPSQLHESQSPSASPASMPTHTHRMHVRSHKQQHEGNAGTPGGSRASRVVEEGPEERQRMECNGQN